MTARRSLSLAGAMVLIAGALIGGATSASANEVWHQSVGRASATATCPTSSAADLAVGWSEWGASWSQWMNSGTGGFTCDREITWASSPPWPGCVYIFTEAGPTPIYVNFGNNPYLPQAPLFVTVDCSGSPSPTSTDLAFASHAEEAVRLCGTSHVTSYGGSPYFGNHSVWQCLRVV